MAIPADGVESHAEAFAALNSGFEIPTDTFDNTFFQNIYRDGLSRVGVMTLFMDSRGQLLMLQHAKSEKSHEGMWGALGETSTAQFDGERWHLEAPVRTALRGLEEELGVVAEAYELQTFAQNAAFAMEWPVGVHQTGQRVFAICPIFIISDELRQRILDTPPPPPPDGEIIDRAFFSDDQARVLGSYRPGMVEWFAELGKISERRVAELIPVATPPELDPSRGRIIDAVLADMFGPRNAIYTD